MEKKFQGKVAIVTAASFWNWKSRGYRICRKKR